MKRRRVARPIAAVSVLLAILLTTQALPFTALAGHGQTRAKLDEATFDGEDGYVAWRLNVTPPEGQARSWVYIDLGNESTSPYRFEDAEYGHLGFWMVNLDIGYVWYAVGATFATSQGRVNVETHAPTKTDHRVALPGDAEDHGWAYLPAPAGEWLVLVTWATDGQLDANVVLSGETSNGEPLVDLVNTTRAGDVFAYETADFAGGTNVGAATPRHDFPNFQPWSQLPESGQARTTRKGHAIADIEHRLFGLFTIPGSVDAHGGWQGPQGGDSGDQTYWFSGARPGAYDFVADRSTHVGERAPIAAFGADVQIPTTPEEAN